MFSRRDFIRHVGGMTAATAGLYAMPEFLRWRGWWSAAHAQDLTLVRDTYAGVAAMLWPGDDRHSVVQGESAASPGAVAAGAAEQIVTALDHFLPAPDLLLPTDLSLPLSGAVASALNAVALSVKPEAVAGPLLAPFARLGLAQKAETWRRLEQDTQLLTHLDFTHSLGVLQFVFGNLPAFVLFLAFSEAGVYDVSRRRLRQRPQGWDHTGYLGTALVTADGWNEFKGYYRGRRKAVDSWPAM